MAFEIEKFIEERKYLYHSTSSCNLQNIVAGRKLISACKRMGMQSGEPYAEQRQLALPLSTGHLQTQHPLRQGQIKFGEGWDLPRLIARLNELIFFWPSKSGNEDGPSDYGRRHFSKNAWPSKPLIIRLNASEVLGENHTPAFFCRFNSGSPRCSNGKKSPRDSSTFAVAHSFMGTLCDVVEVAFEAELTLPSSTEISEGLDKPFRLLFQ